eukprot:9541422-Prorocentrum_lima.AAC.1
MTSSLVGSEMCIRDRRFCGSGAVEASVECFGASYVFGVLCVLVSIDVSVSYTHLTLPTICSV